MNRRIRTFRIALLAAAVAVIPTGATMASATAAPMDAQTLTRTIAKLDADAFDAYNRCDLKAFGNFFAFNLEFYHDKAGVTWTRRRMLDNTRRFICGKVRRELVAGSLQVYPIGKFGAVEMGEHRFCRIGTDTCEGVARFVHIWKQSGGGWMMTRVISYDHQEMPAT